MAVSPPRSVAIRTPAATRPTLQPARTSRDKAWPRALPALRRRRSLTPRPNRGRPTRAAFPEAGSRDGQSVVATGPDRRRQAGWAADEGCADRRQEIRDAAFWH